MSKVARRLALGDEVEAKASLRTFHFECFSRNLIPQSAEGTPSYPNGQRKEGVKLWC